MADNYYSEINLHLVWHTKLSRPLLTREVEPMAWAMLREKILSLGDIFLHEINGTETHVHLAVTIEPNVTISEMVGAIKGYSSHEVNRRSGLGRKVLEWQTGYGVVSFGTKDLPWVVAYIRNQKEHHSLGNAHDRLERIHKFDDGPPEADSQSDEAP